MELITPDIGLLFWMLLTFSIVLFILRKKAWGPIMSALSDREESIQGALDAAKEAKEEMARLQASNEDLLRAARDERDAMLKEAREMKTSIVSKAEAEAREKADLIVAKAMEDIQNEKKAAMTELKNQVAEISLDIAEKVIRKDLATDSAQKGLVDELIKDMKLS
jgi:F-type H+-transporting ATPase subunit b